MSSRTNDKSIKGELVIFNYILKGMTNGMLLNRISISIFLTTLLFENICTKIVFVCTNIAFVNSITIMHNMSSRFDLWFYDVFTRKSFV